LSFIELRETLEMTDGNLTTHIRTLQEAGYVSVAKSYRNNRRLTTVSMTAGGRKPLATTWACSSRSSGKPNRSRSDRGPGRNPGGSLVYNFAAQSVRETEAYARGEAMRVLRASHLGMCFGVRDAIAKVLRAGAREPLTVLGELVHNEAVLDQLAARGIRLRHEVAEVDTPAVAITAHGASDRRRAAVRERGLRILDATCPIVRAAHRAVAALAADGFHPVIVGTPNHVEVRG